VGVLNIAQGLKLTEYLTAGVVSTVYRIFVYV